MEITDRDITAWLQTPHTAEALRTRFQECDALIEQLHQVKRFIALHVDPLPFRVWKTASEVREILRANGLDPNFNPVDTPKEVMETLLDDITTDQEGCFRFEPGRIYLAYTREQVSIPLNKLWRMRSYFILDSGETTPLRTNFNAPSLKGGSRGPQTYEILNEDSKNYQVDVSRLVCLTAIIPVPPSTPRAGFFTVQSGRKPSLGEFTRW